MAIQAAHFTSTLQIKPSIFEIIAQNSLNDTLSPAAQKLFTVNLPKFDRAVNNNRAFKVLATNFPSKFGWLCDNHDEIFFVLNGILQSHYITRYGNVFINFSCPLVKVNFLGASFAENFYGLQRIPIDANKTLSNFDRSLSLITLLVFPYLRRKLEDRIAVYRLEKAESRLQNVCFRNYKKCVY